MATAKIKWTQRVAGRDEGHVEIVEIDTPFMKGCLTNRRYEVLEYIEPEKPKPAAPKAKVDTAKKDDGGVEAKGRTWV